MSDPIMKGLEETKVEYKNLGKSGLRVSVPIFGCMSFGQTEWQPWVISKEEAKPLLKAAYDRGLNTWDTANVYSNGNSEEIIGETIREFKIPREKLVLLSKCYGFVGEDPGFTTQKHGKIAPSHKDYVNRGGLSRGAIFKACDATLKRLGTDYLDLLQIHRFDPITPIEETMKALHDLVQMGKVNYIGASSMWAYQFAMMQFTAEKNGWTKFVSMQNHYSLLYREEEREMTKFCHETGVGLIPWGPLYAGRLARPASAQGSTDRSSGQPDLTPKQTEIINRVEELSKKKGWTMSQVALAWIAPKISSPIIGFSSVKRIDEAIEMRGKVLTAEEDKYLSELYEPRAIEGFA